MPRGIPNKTTKTAGKTKTPTKAAGRKMKKPAK
jgi:hypothetical protein